MYRSDLKRTIKGERTRQRWRILYMTDLVSKFLCNNQNEKQGWLRSLDLCQMLLCNTLWGSMESILWVVQSSLFLSYLLTISPLLKKFFSRFWSSFSSICWSYFFFYLSGIAGYSGDFDVISTITSVQHADLAFVTRIKQAEYLLARLIPLK